MCACECWRLVVEHLGFHVVSVVTLCWVSNVIVFLQLSLLIGYRQVMTFSWCSSGVMLAWPNGFYAAWPACLPALSVVGVSVLAGLPQVSAWLVERACGVVLEKYLPRW